MTCLFKTHGVRCTLKSNANGLLSSPVSGSVIHVWLSIILMINPAFISFSLPFSNSHTSNYSSQCCSPVTRALSRGHDLHDNHRYTPAIEGPHTHCHTHTAILRHADAPNTRVSQPRCPRGRPTGSATQRHSSDFDYPALIVYASRPSPPLLGSACFLRRRSTEKL